MLGCGERRVDVTVMATADEPQGSILTTTVLPRTTPVSQDSNIRGGVVYSVLAVGRIGSLIQASLEWISVIKVGCANEVVLLFITLALE